MGFGRKASLIGCRSGGEPAAASSRERWLTIEAFRRLGCGWRATGPSQSGLFRDPEGWWRKARGEASLTGREVVLTPP